MLPFSKADEARLIQIVKEQHNAGHQKYVIAERLRREAYYYGTRLPKDLYAFIKQHISN
jgi:hypothetical protein